MITLIGPELQFRVAALTVIAEYWEDLEHISGITLSILFILVSDKLYEYNANT
jgi:hypothetical protein